MIRLIMSRLALILLVLIAVALPTGSATTQAQSAAAAAAQLQTAPRAIRRDVPLTNSIRRAFDAGTRDLSGRPGPNYW